MSQNAVDAMEFTGERFVPEVEGDLALEHLHRYAMASRLVDGKDVLDIACGEGYGSAMLAKSGGRVVGVDISEEAIAFASKRYRDAKIDFRVGTCAQIPVSDSSVDVIVSFETIEHHDAHEAMMKEFRRVLRADGMLIISSPDKYEYSDASDEPPNPYHVKELYRREFEGLLASHFAHVALLGQRVVYGSAIVAEGATHRVQSYSYGDSDYLPTPGLTRPLYLVAVASDAPLPVGATTSSVFQQALNDSGPVKYWIQLVRDLEGQLTHESHQLTHESNRAAALETELNDSLLAVARLSETIGDLHENVARLEDLQRNTEARIEALKRTASWRLTKPLRMLRAAIRRVRKWLRRSWSLQGAKGSSRTVYSVGPDGSLPVADGTFEWIAYPTMAASIRERENERIANLSPNPLPIADLATQELRDAVPRLMFPRVASVEVSIIVPVYNNLKYTVECLLSISKFTSAKIGYEVIVADDASTDDTASLLSSVPNLVLTRNSENLGFLRNCNEALQHARGKYVLFLNNDVQVTQGWLEGLLRTIRETPAAGAVGPMIVFPNGRLQEAGARLRRDGTAEMIGLFDSPDQPRFRYSRDVDYCSGACLLVDAELLRQLGGFDEQYAPAYCEDSDLCLRIRREGRRVVYCPDSVVVHHLSKTTAQVDDAFKTQCVVANQQRLLETWQEQLEVDDDVTVIAFYLPQFHPIPENDVWWGKGFTEWTNVAKARPNFVGHYQPRHPADLGYYDLRLPQVLTEQVRLAQRYGVDAFCFYYYWFAGKRLLEQPIEQLLEDDDFSAKFCLCWANENWTRRWDGMDSEVLIAQEHSDEDDEAVIRDLSRFFRHAGYIRIDGKPLLLVYRVTLFPDFVETARRWRAVCRALGIGEIFLVMVESFEQGSDGSGPAKYGCDAAVDFAPHGTPGAGAPSGPVTNPNFHGTAIDYDKLVEHFTTRPIPAYPRFRTVIPGWDNTARRQDHSLCLEHATPGAFQAWLENAIEETKRQCSPGQRLVFINAWNEWAEGTYLEPDKRFGHTFLEAVRNAKDASSLIRTPREGS